MTDDLPRWFDPERHLHSDVGVMELATGVFLAGDGLPSAPARRAAALREAGATTDPLGIVSDELLAAAPKPAAPAKKSRRAPKKTAPKRTVAPPPAAAAPPPADTATPPADPAGQIEA